MPDDAAIHGPRPGRPAPSPRYRMLQELALDPPAEAGSAEPDIPSLRPSTPLGTAPCDAGPAGCPFRRSRGAGPGHVTAPCPRRPAPWLRAAPRLAAMTGRLSSCP